MVLNINKIANQNKRYVLAITLEDKPGALTRVTGLFARRAFNIHYLTVGPTSEKNISKAIIITDEYNASIEQIIAQVQKLVYVLNVQLLDDRTSDEYSELIADLLEKL